MRAKSGTRHAKKTVEVSSDRRQRRKLLLAVQAVAHKLSQSGIDVRTAMPDKLKWCGWIVNNESMSNEPNVYTGQVAECLRLFKQRVGFMPKIIVIDVRHRTIAQWHPKLLSPQDVEQLRVGLKAKGGAAKKVKAGRKTWL